MRLVVLCLAISMAYAQRIPTPILTPGPSQELRTHLELTNDQVNRINALNSEFMRFQLEKSRRLAEVQLDVQRELSKSPLDPMAVGLRYVEMEVIRREIEAMRRTTFDEVQKVLTAAQKTKLQSLADAIRMASTGCEAVSNNLLQMPAPVAPSMSSPDGMLAGQTGFASFLLGYPVCVGIPTGVIRTGDFLPVINGSATAAQ